jgi:DedD protein
MAFFKFRFPGQSASSPVLAEAASPGSGESIELVRRRARHRLMGAVVLVLIAVVGFPLMFDTQPRPVAVDTPILIPDRPSTAAVKASQTPPVDATPAKPLLPEPQALPAKEGLDAKEEVVSSAAPVPAEEAKRPQEPEPKPAETAPKPVLKPKDDGLKAKALLEGKPPAAGGERHVLQVGAFSDPAKVREVRRKLEQAGWSTFTQVVDGKDGKTTTRVRVGPFSSREEADKAAARIRKLDFTVAVLRI